MGEEQRRLKADKNPQRRGLGTQRDLALLLVCSAALPNLSLLSLFFAHPYFKKRSNNVCPNSQQDVVQV